MELVKKDTRNYLVPGKQMKQNFPVLSLYITKCFHHQYSTIGVPGDGAANKQYGWKIIRNTNIPYCCLKILIKN